MLPKTLKQDARFVSQDWILLKNIIREQAEKLDPNLISLLLEDEQTRARFFIKIKDALVFDLEAFKKYLKDWENMSYGYTTFKRTIWLVTEDGDFLKKNTDVVINFPFKDCVLAGGQDKEDVKRDEMFYHEVLHRGEIDRLLDQKMFTGFKKLNADWESDFDCFHRDETGLIKDNLIIKGNNLLVLHSLKSNFAGKVKLIYIDPPYNTGNDGFQYNDRFNHSTWLTFMKNRLEVAKELLSDDGSIYINLDYNEVHYCKVLMDEIFWVENFQREIIWRMGWLSGYKTIARNYIRNHDTILFYSKKPDRFIFNKIYNTIENYSERFNSDQKKEILLKLWESWLWKEKQEEILKFISEIWFPTQYPIEDTWNCSIYDKLNSIAVVSFSWEKVSKMLWTDEIKWQKSESLLERIIQVSTQPWDIVLDYHLWSGTTCAVAHKMGRQYIGIEQMDYIETITLERMKKVMAGEQWGISKSQNWNWGWELITMELMQQNHHFLGQIHKATTIAQLQQLYQTLQKWGFINYKIDTTNLNLDNIQEQDFEHFKQFLCEIIDKNQLYQNFSERDDETLKISDQDKKLNENFYNFSR